MTRTDPPCDGRCVHASDLIDCAPDVMAYPDPSCSLHGEVPPKRIQLRRTKGWRKPEGAVVVARPSKCGNPFSVERVWDGQFGWVNVATDGRLRGPDRLDHAEAVADAVEMFALHAGPMGAHELDDADIEALRGHDLGCWCPFDQPCHADVLLEWANR